MRAVKGKIDWFDYREGDGMLALDSGEKIFIHFTQVYTPSNGNYCRPSRIMQKRLPKLIPEGHIVEVLINNQGQIIKITPIGD